VCCSKTPSPTGDPGCYRPVLRSRYMAPKLWGIAERSCCVAERKFNDLRASAPHASARPVPELLRRGPPWRPQFLLNGSGREAPSVSAADGNQCRCLRARHLPAAVLPRELRRHGAGRRCDPRRLHRPVPRAADHRHAPVDADGARRIGGGLGLRPQARCRARARHSTTGPCCGADQARRRRKPVRGRRPRDGAVAGDAAASSTC